MPNEKILLHICCGPCACYPVKWLQEQGFTVYGFFYNPNIHPYTEYAKRLANVRLFAEQTGIKVIYKDDYDLDEFLRQVAYREGNRCRVCYALRLRQAAGVAKKGNFPYYTTTLLVSPYQQHGLIKEMGEAIGKEYGVEFFYHDFRQGWQAGVALSKAYGLYRQPYCGCIYSERDRYQQQKTARNT